MTVKRDTTVNASAGVGLLPAATYVKNVTTLASVGITIPIGSVMACVKCGMKPWKEQLIHSGYSAK